MSAELSEESLLSSKGLRRTTVDAGGVTSVRKALSPIISFDRVGIGFALIDGGSLLSCPIRGLGAP